MHQYYARLEQEARRLHQRGFDLRKAVARARKRASHPHRSKGLATKLGGPCKEVVS